MVCGWRTKVIHFPCLVLGSHRDIILVYSSNWFAHVMWNFGFSLEVVLEWIHFLTVTTTWYQLQIEMLAVLVTSLSHCGGKYMNSLWTVPNMGIHTLAGHVFRRKKVWKVWELHCMSCFFFGSTSRDRRVGPMDEGSTCLEKLRVSSLAFQNPPVIPLKTFKKEAWKWVLSHRSSQGMTGRRLDHIQAAFLLVNVSWKLWSASM